MPKNKDEGNKKIVETETKPEPAPPAPAPQPEKKTNEKIVYKYVNRVNEFANKIFLIDIGADNYATFPKVKRAYTYYDEKDKDKSGTVLEYRSEPRLRNWGIPLGGSLGVIFGLLIGFGVKHIIAMIVAPISLALVMGLFGALAFKWMQFTGEMKECIVPTTYHKITSRYGLIVVKRGENIVSYPTDGEYPKGCGTDYSTLMHKHLWVSVYRHLKKGMANLIMAILMIVGLIVVGYMIYKTTSKPALVPTNNVTALAGQAK